MYISSLAVQELWCPGTACYTTSCCHVTFSQGMRDPKDDGKNNTSTHQVPLLLEEGVREHIVGADATVLGLVRLFRLQAGTRPKKGRVISKGGEAGFRVITFATTFLVLLLDPVHLYKTQRCQH